MRFIFCCLILSQVISQTECVAQITPYSESLNGSYMNVVEEVWDEMMVESSNDPEVDFYITSFFSYTDEEGPFTEIREGSAFFDEELNAYTVYFEGEEESIVIWFEQKNNHTNLFYQYDKEIEPNIYSYVPTSDFEEQEYEVMPIPERISEMIWENNKSLLCFYSDDISSIKILPEKSGFIGVIKTTVFDENDGEIYFFQYFMASEPYGEKEIEIDLWIEYYGEMGYLKSSIEIGKEKIAFEGYTYKKLNCKN